MINKEIIKGAALSILMLLLGMIIGKYAFPGSNLNVVAGRDQIIQDLRQKLASKESKGLILPISQSEKQSEQMVNSVSGEVSRIDAARNNIEIKIDNIYREGDFFSFLDEQDFTVKTIRISKDTKISRTENLSAEEQEQAVKDYVKKENPDMPSRFSVSPVPTTKDVPMSINDLKVGHKISVGSETQFKIKDKADVDAKTINVVSQPDPTSEFPK